MGLIRATLDTIGGSFADQWVDFLTVPLGISQTAALFPAVPSGTNHGRGSNTNGSSAILTNGSKIIVPEGYGLLIFQDGALTAFVDVPGAYIWDSDSVDSQSIFAGDKWSTSLVKQSWERFKFGGRPGTQQLAIFVTLKELPNNKFGTQSPIYWDDAYLNAQVGAIAHGTYSLSITDPILFAKQFVPAIYLQGSEVFDFTDRTNSSASQLFSEVIGSLAAAFSSYTNKSDRSNRITKIQQDSVGFSQTLSQAVEDAYKWRSTRGLEITKVAIVGIRYDESTTELLKTVQRADALSGNRGNVNLQASIAEGMQSAGKENGANGIIGLGIANGAIGVSALAHQAAKNEPHSIQPPDLIKTLEGLKRAHDGGLISKEEFDAAKSKALGLS
jgi:membrane protease subunit (stomatin/prohibitin family)